MATARPMVTTSFGIAAAVRRCRKIEPLEHQPEQRGEHDHREERRAGTIAHPHSTRALKYMAAETYACAPNARLNTPDVL